MTDIQKLQDDVQLIREQVAILTGSLKQLNEEYRLDLRITPMEKEINKRVEPKTARIARELLPGSLTVQQTAKELGVTPKTIRNYINQGLLDSEMVAGRRMIIKESFETLKNSMI